MLPAESAATPLTVRFYFHDAATADAGILPATNDTATGNGTAATPGTGGAPSLINKSMNATIGVLQKSVALTTLASVANQQQPIVRFCSEPIAAQSIDIQQIFTLHGATSESNTNSNFNCAISIMVWRPSTGAVVAGAPIYDSVTIGALLLGPTSTSETAMNALDANATGDPLPCLDGDILIVELWRNTTVQGMATAYTNTVFYDGTIEDSATSNAAYLLFANDVLMLADVPPAATGLPGFPTFQLTNAFVMDMARRR